jgi:hypothetical protein
VVVFGIVEVCVIDGERTYVRFGSGQFGSAFWWRIRCYRGVMRGVVEICNIDGELGPRSSRVGSGGVGWVVLQESLKAKRGFVSATAG